jgi:hypothetical protein
MHSLNLFFSLRFPLLLILSISSSLIADDLADSWKQSCVASQASIDPPDLKTYIDRMDFLKDIAYCDALPKDKFNCRASSRFWLAFEYYAIGEFEKAEQLFTEGLDLVRQFGSTKEFIQFRPGKTGWGNPEDFLRYVKSAKQMNWSEPAYVQNISYLVISDTNATNSAKPEIKVYTKAMDPCLALHGLHSLKVLRQSIRIFSQGKIEMQIHPTSWKKTVTVLDGKNLPNLSSVVPWDRQTSIYFNEILKENDLVFLTFPRNGGNATAQSSGLPIIPGLITSKRRYMIRLPSEWLRLENYPQIFHEYMHTVEFAMIQNGDKNFHATHHGSDSKRIGEITPLDPNLTGESDWAEYFYPNNITSLVKNLEATGHKNGWEKLFGTHIHFKNNFETAQINKVWSLLDELGEEEIKNRKSKSKQLIDFAYTAYNKEKNYKKAAELAVSAFELLPYSVTYHKKSKWFIENGKLSKNEKLAFQERLDAAQITPTTSEGGEVDSDEQSSD